MDKPTYKLYNDTAILIGGLIGGPLALGYLFRSNYLKLGDTVKARKAIYYAAGALLVVVLLAYFVPGLPTPAIPVGTVIAGRQIATMEFGRAIAEHQAAGGSLMSYWNAAGMGLLFLVCTLLLSVLAFI